MPLLPHQFWQTIDPVGTHDETPEAGWLDGYPAALPDRRQILLPIRVLPGDGTTAVASLIVNQASFAVEDASLRRWLTCSRPTSRRLSLGCQR